MNIINWSERPADCIRVCRRTRTVAEIYFPRADRTNYKLCVTMKTLHRIAYALHVLVKSEFDEIVVPLRGDRYLYLGKYRGHYFLSLECLNETRLHLIVNEATLMHFYATAQSVLRYPSGTVLKSLLGVIATQASHKNQYGNTMASFVWVNKDQGKYGKLGRMGVD